METTLRGEMQVGGSTAPVEVAVDLSLGDVPEPVIVVRLRLALPENTCFGASGLLDKAALAEEARQFEELVAGHRNTAYLEDADGPWLVVRFDALPGQAEKVSVSGSFYDMPGGALRVEVDELAHLKMGSLKFYAAFQGVTMHRSEVSKLAGLLHHCLEAYGDQLPASLRGGDE